MNAPIQIPQPVNPVVTIQPIIAALSNQATGGQPNPLAAVAPGTLVEGFVINRDTQNNPIVRTAIGDLKVTSNVFLKTGSEVVFRVDTSQASLARIVSVDGLTPDAYNALNQSAALADDTITTTGLQAPAMPIAGKALSANLPAAGPPVLQAIVLQTQPQAAHMNNAATPPMFMPSQATHAAGALSATFINPSIQQFAGIKPGTTLRLTLLDLKLPPLPIALSAAAPSNKLDALLPAQSPPSTSSQPLTAGVKASPFSLSTPAAGAAKQPTNPTQDELAPLQFALQQHEQVRDATQLARAIRTLQQAENILFGTTEGHTEAPAAKPALHPAPAATAPTPPREGGIFTAHVIGHDADGGNILHTPAASLKIYTSQPLPTGTTLVLQAPHEVLQSPAVTTSSVTRTTAPVEETLVLLRQQDDAVGEAAQWLHAQHPENMQDPKSRMPTTNHKLASDLLFFIAALNGGDAASLFGARATRQLELQAPTLFGKLKQQLAAQRESASASAADAPPWLHYTLPLLHGPSIEVVRLYVQREPEDTQAATQSSGQRFVLELQLSALGPMQLDGFIRKQDRGRHFDLMIRTEKPLDPDISQQIREIFSASAAATRLVGQVVFQVGQQYFFRPPPTSATPPGDGGMQTILA